MKPQKSDLVSEEGVMKTSAACCKDTALCQGR